MLTTASEVLAEKVSTMNANQTAAERHPSAQWSASANDVVNCTKVTLARAKDAAAQN
jgi:hypothetical protein